MAENKASDIIGNLMNGLDTVLATKTVVGEATRIGDTVIIPLIDVSFGVGAASSNGKGNSDNGGGGLTGKMSPCAVLVINNGSARLVNVKTTDNVSRALDLIPEIINKFKPNKDVTDDDIREAAFPGGEV